PFAARLRSILAELVERGRPVAGVRDIEVRVARMTRDSAPVARVLHRMNERTVAAGGFTEAPAVAPVLERAEFTVDERNELARQMIGIAADARRVHVLIAAVCREAIRKHEDARRHLARGDQPRGALGHVLVEV